MSLNQINYILAICSFALVNIFLLTFSGRFEGDKSQNSIFISVLGSTYHIHHWMIGLFCLIIILIAEQFFGRNPVISIVKGVSFGLMFHGLAFYTDYFSIRR